MVALDTSKHTIIFIVDTSGSMYGQKIEAVNAAVAECAEVIRNNNRDNSLQVGYVTFDEEWGNLVVKNEIGTVGFKIKANADGFYRLTKYQCLYEGVENCLVGFNNSKTKLCLLLITDGKPSDSGKYIDVLERVKNMDAFRNSERLVALVDNEVNGMDNDILEFVGYKADKVVKLNDVVSALLKVSFLSGFNSGSNSANADHYNTIFGD